MGIRIFNDNALEKYKIECTVAGMVKRNYQPKRRKRSRTHGYMKRTSTPTGRAVLVRRRRKGRKSLTV